MRFRRDFDLGVLGPKFVFKSRNNHYASKVLQIYTYISVKTYGFFSIEIGSAFRNMAESEVFELITSTNEFVERYPTRNNKPEGTSSQHKSGINTRSKLRRKTTASKNCSDSSSEDDSSER